MFRGLYTGYTGMVTQQQKLDTIANNLANVDTVGYKKDQVVQGSFKEMLTLKIKDPEVPNNSAIGKMSLGNQVQQVYTNFLQGSLKQTDEPLNVALQGEGFIKVSEKTGEEATDIRYTRDGALKLNQEGQLVTNTGLFVLGEDNQPIKVGAGRFFINRSGDVYKNDTMVGKIQLTAFEDPKKLRKQGDNIYKATEGVVEKAFEGTIEQGFIESSNVNSIQEMVDMIATNRTYEANQRIIRTYDETMQKVVNNVGQL